MSLRAVFIVNLKKFRKRERISQMKLAEICDTATSYIGEIEIGRKFPSIEMVEKIANALKVEPYRLFIDDSAKLPDNEKALAFYSSLPPEGRKAFMSLITSAVSASIEKALSPENNP
jgi:transcriptional regulator with XRE-family HTH domain